MICENCRADVPKTHLSSDGRRYCCAGCIFHPLGCRCKFGEFGVVQDEDIDFSDEDYSDEDYEVSYSDVTREDWDNGDPV